MLFFDIPEYIDKWNLDTLKKISSIGSVENNLFEIKGKEKIDGDASKAICSFANSNGGYLIFGIDEDRDTKNPLERFKLNGFDINVVSEDDTLKKIASHIYRIEPPPQIIRKCIQDKETYFVVLQILVEEEKKPFFANNTCYIRIDGTSRPASRSVILAMMNNHIISQDKRDEHKNYIISIFEKLKNLEIKKENYDKYHISVPYSVEEYENYFIDVISPVKSEDHVAPPSMQPLERLLHLEWAISHLKDLEYKKPFVLYDRILNNVKEFNSIIGERKNDFKKEFDTEVSNLFFDKIDYKLINTRSDGDNIIIKQVNRLDPGLFYEHIFENIVIYGDHADIDFLRLCVGSKGNENEEILLQKDNNNVLVNSNGESVRISPVIDNVNRIIERGLSIMSDAVSFKREFDQNRQALEKELDLLINDLKAGDILKGYCKIGY